MLLSSCFSLFLSFFVVAHRVSSHPRERGLDYEDESEDEVKDVAFQKAFMLEDSEGNAELRALQDVKKVLKAPDPKVPLNVQAELLQLNLLAKKTEGYYKPGPSYYYYNDGAVVNHTTDESLTDWQDLAFQNARDEFMHRTRGGAPQPQTSRYNNALEASRTWMQGIPLTPSTLLTDGVYSHCARGGQLALTFDDGPSQYTGHLLDLLLKYNVKATFFVLGENVTNSKRRNCLRRMRDEGHVIGSHTWSHPDLTTLSDEEIEAEMTRTNELIEEVTGLRPIFMRPPFGATDARVTGVLNRLGFKVIKWNLDTMDWAHQLRDPGLIYKSYKDQLSTAVRPSASYIALQHDTYGPTVASQKRILSYILHQTTYSLVSLDKCIDAPPYA